LVGRQKEFRKKYIHGIGELAGNDRNFGGGGDGRRHGMLVFNDWRIARFPQSLSSSRPPLSELLDYEERMARIYSIPRPKLV
jgi:hypothetical protein